MRLFFFMLLLLNGAFLAVNVLQDPKAPQIQINIDGSIPQLALLSEKNKNNEKTIVNNSLKPSEKPEQEPSLDLQAWLQKFTAETANTDTQNNGASINSNTQTVTSQCYTAGPFQNPEKLQLATDFFTDSQIKYQQRSIIENHYIGMLVYLPSKASRDAIVTVAKKLAAKGVKDYMLLNEPGKEHSLSLGVYGLKKNAVQRIKALSKLNYEAKSEARYRKKTIYWLDYAFDDNDDRTQLSAQQMKSLNASQIERNCKS